MRIKTFLLFCLTAILLATPVYGEKAKNIIFLIGDGMGLNQMYAGMTRNGNFLNLEQSQYVGLTKTYSANSFITDSGAGGTALASGVKTNNGMIGMTPDSVAVKSILHIANENGKATGIVVVCSVTHATPAAFVAHQPNRNMDKEIAADYLKTDIDVFVGGGRKFFENGIDNRNLINELRKKNYQICNDLSELQNAKSGKIAALLYDEHPGKAAERNDMLAIATQKTLDILSQNENGFFLMIEGSQIDWAAHNNDTEYLIGEMLDFDNTVGIAIDFAKKHGNTLVVIVADHETGGMSVADGNFDTGEVLLKFTSDYHTGVPVPVYSYGTGAENFTGIFENTAFLEKFLKVLKIK